MLPRMTDNTTLLCKSTRPSVLGGTCHLFQKDCHDLCCRCRTGNIPTLDKGEEQHA